MAKPQPIHDLGETYSTGLLLIKQSVEEKIQTTLKETTVKDCIYDVAPKIEADEKRLQKLYEVQKNMKARLDDSKDFLNEIESLNTKVAQPLLNLASQTEDLVDFVASTNKIEKNET